MDKIQGNTLSRRTGNEPMTHHIPPPAVAVLKGSQLNNNKTKSVKALGASMFMNSNKAKELPHGGEFWGKPMSKLETLLYRTLLVILYISYGLFRYGQYQYNKMKLRILNVIYNPASTPQLIRQDVRKLEKIPKRIAAILEMKPVGFVGGGLKGLLNDGSEIVCWTVSAGIKHLMLYDYDGILQKNVSEFQTEIENKLTQYYGPGNVPNYAIKIPHSNKTVSYTHLDVYKRQVYIRCSFI